MRSRFRVDLSIAFYAYGHRAIRSTHPSTIEITKEHDLSPRGDCIVAVNSSIGPNDLPQDFRETLAKPGAKAQLVLKLDRFKFSVKGEGDPRLTLSHPTDFVIRTSSFISNRTLMIRANKASSDLPREMVQMLRDPRNRLTIEISAASSV